MHNGLRGNDGYLESHSRSEAGQYLISNPLATRGTDVERVHQAGGYRCNCAPANEERHVVAGCRHQAGRDDHGQRDRDDDGKVSHARANGAGVIDRLEVDG